MNILVDTNILLQWFDHTSPDHELCRAAVQRTIDDGGTAYVNPQVCVEFWAVGTKTQKANGFGFDTDRAEEGLVAIRAYFEILDATPAVFDTWRDLVVRHDVRGVNTYDARVAASMITHNVPRLVTFNLKDFRRYGLDATDPSSLAGG